MTICSRPYKLTKLHKEIKKKVERLVLLGVPGIENDSEWWAPPFVQPKPKNIVRFQSYFRNLNKQLKCKTYPIPKINERLLKL